MRGKFNTTSASQDLGKLCEVNSCVGGLSLRRQTLLPIFQARVLVSNETELPAIDARNFSLKCILQI